MSIPPGNNYYAIPPNSPPASNSGGCWKAAGITCGVLFLVMLIGGIMLVRWGKQQFSHPSNNNPVGAAILVVKVTTDGESLQQAVVQYHQKNGKYPKVLTDLVADGETGGKILHNDLDSNPSPAHISWVYHKPAEGASGKTPILQQPYQVNISSSQPPQNGNITIDLDGKADPGTNHTTTAPGT